MNVVISPQPFVFPRGLCFCFCVLITNSQSKSPPSILISSHCMQTYQVFYLKFSISRCFWKLLICSILEGFFVELVYTSHPGPFLGVLRISFTFPLSQIFTSLNAFLFVTFLFHCDEAYISQSFLKKMYMEEVCLIA